MTSFSSRILVVSACSKRKRPGDQLPARTRYEGRSHQLIRDAIDRWRVAMPQIDLQWSIVSAGLGLVDEHQLIPEYEATFAGLPTAEAGARGAELHIPQSLDARSATADIDLIILSRQYLAAAHAPLRSLTTQVYLAAPTFAGTLDSSGTPARLLSCGVEDARLLGAAPREVGAVRFSHFVDQVIQHGLQAALDTLEPGTDAA